MSISSPPIPHPHRTGSAGQPFLVVAVACVIGGGLVSAALAPAASYHSSWAVAYVVLVAGVAQAALGLGQARVTGGDVSRRVVRSELAAWNLGNAAVVAGTLLNLAPALYAGSVLLLLALGLVLFAIRDAQPGLALVATRVIVVLLGISMPVGIVLQAVTH